MSYYIIDTKTNKINPNAILSETALFEIKQDFIDANALWLKSNKTAYQYRPATKDELLKYQTDFLDYVDKNKITSTIVVNHKNNVNDVQRVDVKYYIVGQITEQIGIMEYMYPKATGTVLSNFIANEQANKIIQTQNDKNDIFNKGCATIYGVQDIVLSTTNMVVNGTTIATPSVARLLQICTDKSATNKKTVELFTINARVYFVVFVEDIQETYMPIIAQNKDNVHSQTFRLIAKLTEMKLDAKIIGQQILDFIATVTPAMLDPDNVKDGTLTIIIDDKKIKVYQSSNDVEITNNPTLIKNLINL